MKFDLLLLALSILSFLDVDSFLFLHQSAEEDEEYQQLMSNQIDFILEDLMKGEDPTKMLEQMLDSKKSAEAAAAAAEASQKSKFDQIQESRRMLPIFPYREELLQAINDNQILVIVGETGSGKTTQVSNTRTILAHSITCHPLSHHD